MCHFTLSVVHMSKLRWRFPDRPLHVFSLSMVKDGEWLSQTKYDGHFAVIIKEDDKISVMSRHAKPLPVSKPLMDELNYAQQFVPNGTCIHGEWTSRRESNKVESLYLFSVVYHNFEWLGQLGEEDRWKRLEIVKQTDKIFVVDSKITNYADHYRSTVGDMKTEGIVLKKRDSKLYGDLKTPKDNAHFLKLKWREGADGMTRSIVSDDKLVCVS